MHPKDAAGGEGDELVSYELGPADDEDDEEPDAHQDQHQRDGADQSRNERVPSSLAERMVRSTRRV